MENKARRYNEEEKKQLLERYQGLLKEGKSVVEAAKDIGVSYVTIRAWQKKDGKKPVATAASKAKAKKARPGKKTKIRTGQKVRVRKPTRPPRQVGKNLVVVMPNGYRIEGFTVDELIKLLKAVK